MFSDDNPVSSATTVQAQEQENSHKPGEGAPAETQGGDGVVPEGVSHSEGAHAEAAVAPTEHVKPEEVHAKAEEHAQTVAADAEAATAAEEAAGAEEMSKLIDQYSEPQETAQQNEIIEVKVVAYTEQGVVVDVGGKTEGLIPAAEFTETEIPRPEPNATIEVQRTGETREGFVILSYQKVLRRRTWEKIEAQYKAKETISAKVVDRIKGGLVVDIGVRAFLPGSQYDLRPTANLDGLLGQNVDVRITKLNRRRGNVVVSRRALLEEQLHAKRAGLMEKLSEGQVVHGTVKNVTDYGAFVDLGGIDGLLHLTDLSWGRVR
ncbi:MAG: S1 RNA-binding domain-containing protein, partial [Candidatus Acidiferrum sp.]